MAKKHKLLFQHAAAAFSLIELLVVIGVIIILVAIMALNQVDVDTAFLSQAFLVLFASVCLALSLAFGLGCRDLAGRVAQGWWEREQAASKALSSAIDKFEEDRDSSEGDDE